MRDPKTSLSARNLHTAGPLLAAVPPVAALAYGLSTSGDRDQLAR